MLLSGLCDTPTACRFKIAMSSGVTQTPCAASVRGLQNPMESRYAAGVIWCCSRDWRTSSSVSARWIRIGAPVRRASSEQASSVALSLVNTAWGATAGVIKLSFLKAAMNRSARATASPGVFASGEGNWMTVSPRTPRSPAARVACAISSSK